MYGDQRSIADEQWQVSKAPYSVVNGTNATAALQQAIDDCGDLHTGGTVLVSNNLTLLTASLWLRYRSDRLPVVKPAQRSNLTLRVETGSTLLGTKSEGDAPLVYTRRGCVMMTGPESVSFGCSYKAIAHAGFLNGGKCIKKKDPLVGWDDCAEWEKLENVAIEGGGIQDSSPSNSSGL